jgi:hypothetical protein
LSLFPLLVVEGLEKKKMHCNTRPMPMALWAAAILTVGMMGVQAAETADKGPPPFFLQDPKDSNCLAGETFKRCSIDTLFYVVGSPGKSPLS